MCVNFKREWWDQHFKVNSERQIFKKFFMAVLITLRVFVRNLTKNIFFQTVSEYIEQNILLMIINLIRQSIVVELSQNRLA